MKEVFQSIAAIGGFGYLNYWLFVRLRDRDIGSDIDKKFLIGLMSSFDYVIYLVLMKLSNHLIASVLGAISLSLFLTLFLHKVIDCGYRFTNWVRGKQDLSEQVDVYLWDMMFNSGLECCFIFDFDGHVISRGVMAAQSGMHEEKSLILYPFFDRHYEQHIKSEDELYRYFEEKNIEARIYLNFDKKTKIIYFPLVDD